MKPLVLRTRQFAITLTCVLTLPNFLHRAAAEIPEGLAEALTTHTWSFPGAKPPIYFHNDGAVIDGDYHTRYTWSLDANTGAVHLVEYKWKAKDKDKARVDLWFSKDLTSFTWYDSRTQASGVGSRVDEAASDKTAKHPPAQPAPPAPVAPAALPLPSPQLEKFSNYNLEHLIGPLNNGPLPRTELMNFAVDYAGRLAAADAPEDKSVLEAALKVCSAFMAIMDEREDAVASLQGAGASTSGNLGGTRTANFKDWRDWLQAKREAQEKKSRVRQAQADSAFISSAAAASVNAAWSKRAQPWRLQITRLLVAERQAEALAEAARAAKAAAAAPPGFHDGVVR